MSRKETLIKRLRSKPKDFTITELDTLMAQCGCEKDRKGKTSGSRIAYRHSATGKCLLMHSPHPKKELKPYMVAQVIAFLESVSEI